MAKIDELFKVTVRERASDLHISAQMVPSLRVKGSIQKLNYRALTHEECQALFYEILTPQQIAQLEKNWTLDFSYSAPETGRFRGNIFFQRNGIGAVFRSIPNQVETIESLGLPPACRQMIQGKSGLICVTGPTGSGKSTTLASLIHHINKTKNYHILTIEDPIEFAHEGECSIISQIEVGTHAKSFHKALESALREDPDVILVGEMRDLETISLAITAAETGHLVFGTLHTGSAPKTVDRIIDYFPREEQHRVRMMVSESLKGVISQNLFKRMDSQGQIAAYEIMLNTPAIQNLIRENKNYQIHSVMQTSKENGMQTMEENVFTLISQGLISKKEGMNYLKTHKNPQTDAP